MAALCRRLEKQFHPQEVLSPRPFQAPKERLLPRSDQRKKQQRADILKALNQESSFSSFQRQMQSLGYQVIKGRGISFIDTKQVRTKGSEVGLPLATINKILDLQNKIKTKGSVKKKTRLMRTESLTSSQDTALVAKQKIVEASLLGTLIHELGLLFSEVMKSEELYYGQSFPSLTDEEKNAKKSTHVFADV